MSELPMFANPTRKSLANTSSVQTKEPQQRIHVGSNFSQVQRALRSQTFKPLPAESLEDEEDYEEIVDKSVKDAELKPVSIKQPSSQKKSSQGLRSLSHDERASALIPRYIHN